MLTYTFPKQITCLLINLNYLLLIIYNIYYYQGKFIF